MLERVLQCLELVGLEHVRLANPHELSAGEQQRLGIASALAASPHHLILDEATALLDDQTRIELMARVHALAARLHLGLLIITHRMDEVGMVDRVLVLSQGAVVFDAPPSTLFAQAERLSGWNLALPRLQALALNCVAPASTPRSTCTRLPSLRATYGPESTRGVGQLPH